MEGEGSIKRKKEFGALKRQLTRPDAEVQRKESKQR
jgi:hypothetical protein